MFQGRCTSGWQKTGGKKLICPWEREIELQISCEDFYTLFLLNHQAQAQPFSTFIPPTTNTYSYLPFENFIYVVVKECMKEYKSQICNFTNKNRLITYC